VPLLTNRELADCTVVVTERLDSAGILAALDGETGAWTQSQESGDFVDPRCVSLVVTSDTDHFVPVDAYPADQPFAPEAYPNMPWVQVAIMVPTRYVNPAITLVYSDDAGRELMRYPNPTSKPGYDVSHNPRGYRLTVPMPTALVKPAEGETANLNLTVILEHDDVAEPVEGEGGEPTPARRQAALAGYTFKVSADGQVIEQTEAKEVKKAPAAPAHDAPNEGTIPNPPAAEQEVACPDVSFRVEAVSADQLKYIADPSTGFKWVDRDTFHYVSGPYEGCAYDVTNMGIDVVEGETFYFTLDALGRQ
jgi:hypothetical protein